MHESIVCKVVDSLSTKYRINIDKYNVSRLKSYQYSLNTILVKRDTSINSHYDYADVVQLIDNDNKKLIMEVEYVFKDLTSLFTNSAGLVSTYYSLYEDFFKIMANKQVNYSETFNNKISSGFKSKSTNKAEKTLEVLIQKVLLDCQGKFQYNFKKNPEKVNVSINWDIRYSGDGYILKAELLGDRVDLYYNFQPITTEFFISNDEIKKKEFSYLYARLTTFMYKICKSNFM
ncbi:hypothetical protein GCM10023187_56800 [Nibrella viscosa]|uniref:Uncharacterized protein n=1 Tax=Nibrella viscosa TaxID=1084524 RepID=A0ABP8L1T2_9BACT